MQIVAKCSRCAKQILLGSDAQDRRITCPRCKCLFKVPKLNQIPKAAEIIEQAKSHVYVDKNGNTFA